MSDPAREAAVLAAVAQVPRRGWRSAEFPEGLVVAFAELVDGWMADDAAAADMEGLRTPGRVRAVIALRLARLRPYRAALRQAAGRMLLPGGGRALAGTVDAIWHAAGEALDDGSRHSKRAILSGVYAATLLFWLRRGEEDDAATLDFLDRRLENVAAIGKLRARLGIPGTAKRQTI